jgi:DNA mismatch repair protein MutS
MRQYLDLKKLHKDEILFFRLGDFYEMFFEDARTAARVLSLTLTSRDAGKAGKVPMAGIPFHAFENYIARLVKAGHSVAICEQTEDPELAKGLVKREIVRVITPGTVLTGNLLDEKSNNYLVCLLNGNDRLGMAVADVTTGEFKACELKGPARFSLAVNELTKFSPSEVLLPQGYPSTGEPALLLRVLDGARISRLEDWKFSGPEAQGALFDHFKVASLDGFGLTGQDHAVRAAGAILVYLKETTHSVLSHIGSVSTYGVGEGLVLDAATQRNLEVLKSMRDESKEGTLLSAMDETVTAMGGRLLRQWLVAPLTSVEEIRKRQDAVEEWLSRREERESARETFREVADLERLSGRVGCGAANARDLVALRTTLRVLPRARGMLKAFKARLVKERLEGWDDLKEVEELLSRSIVDEPPLALREGGLIRDGYHAELDALKKGALEGKGWIAGLEEKEKKRTGISSLKVRFTSVFGYYIEVSKANLDKVPADYHRKQTLVNAERFITPELKEMEGKVLGAQEKADKLEYRLFEEVRLQVAKELPRLQRMARALAELDVFACLAAIAERGRFVRPDVNDSQELVILDGRHPVLDRIMASDQFVPNDTHLAEDVTRIMVLTGPNMAGKSTYIRQVALLALMAQAGSFVPAREMRLGVVDRIFSRVGASDALTQGQSTFMVEMVETANILNHATPKSLLILDEVGRGTSTFDGLSIAWAVVEHLAVKLPARTLFATHYHELTKLAQTFPNVKNYNIAVREWNEQILFLRKIVEGGTDKSYGIQVARLAGVPKVVVERAKKILAELEASRSWIVKQVEGEAETVPAPQAAEGVAAASVGRDPGQLSFFTGMGDHPVLAELRDLDLDGLTPLQALNILGEWKKKIES